MLHDKTFIKALEFGYFVWPCDVRLWASSNVFNKTNLLNL